MNQKRYKLANSNVFSLLRK